MTGFKAMMDAMIQPLHATLPDPGVDCVPVAGDPALDIEAERREQEIPLRTTQYEAMVAAGQRANAPGGSNHSYAEIAMQKPFCRWGTPLQPRL